MASQDGLLHSDDKVIGTDVSTWSRQGNNRGPDRVMTPYFTTEYKDQAGYNERITCMVEVMIRSGVKRCISILKNLSVYSISLES